MCTLCIKNRQEFMISTSHLWNFGRNSGGLRKKTGLKRAPS